MFSLQGIDIPPWTAPAQKKQHYGTIGTGSKLQYWKEKKNNLDMEVSFQGACQIIFF